MPAPPYDRVRKQDIRFKRSLFRFIVTFVIVFVVGLFSRLYIQNIPVREILLKSIEFPQSYELELGHPYVRLRNGLLPVVGVYFNRISLEDKKCPLQNIVVQDLLVQLNPWSLFVGNVEVGHVEADFLNVSLAKNCSPSLSQQLQETGVKPEKTSKTSSKVSKKTSKIPSDQELDALKGELESFLGKHFIKTLGIKKMKINYFFSMTNQWSVEGNLEGKFSDNLGLVFDLEKLSFKNQNMNSISSEIKINYNSTGLYFDVKSKLREGKVKAKLALMKNEGWSFSSKIKLMEIPLSSLVSHFVEVGNLKYLWASCQLKLKASIDELMEKPIEFKECLVDGPYGKLALHEIKASLSAVEKLDLEVSNVDLDQVISEKRDFYFSGVFSKYGILSAHAVLNKEIIKVEGYLIDSELVFSNNNLREIQKVKRIPFLFKKEKSKWSALINEVILEDGLFEGELLLNSEGEGGSQGRLAVHRLRTNPRIYKLILNSDPADLRVYGKFNVGKKGVEDWSAMVAAPEVNSEYYQLKNLKVKGQGESGGVAQLKITVGEGEIQVKSPMVNWIQPTQLNQINIKDKLAFRELSTSLEIQGKRNVQWKRGYVRLANGWQLSSEGQRNSQRLVSAWLQWDRPDRKFLKWSYQGEFFKGEWTPETDWVKTWLSKNPEFVKDHDSIKIEGT